ncbi:MAG: thiamine phosphate synthase [Bradyrhizobiaceae bacterium]|nr:thiamine phosphate synthase [Bradyrhizobiaceae bacterium]
MSLARNALTLCLVTDRSFLRGTSLTDVVAAAVRGGATSVQLREKEADSREFLELALALKALLDPLHVPLLINDRVDVALAAGADGVHLGQSDLPTKAARELLGPERTIGLSITQVEEARQADTAYADYLGVGPVFATATKPDAAPALGTEGLARVRALSALPLLAIGGIGEGNAHLLPPAGADGIAVVSAIMGAGDPEAAAQRLAARFTGARQRVRTIHSDFPGEVPSSPRA